jgi:hypothetical protein
VKSTANAPKANAFTIAVHSNPHSVVIFHHQVFIFIPWEREQNFESSDIKKKFLATRVVE